MPDLEDVADIRLVASRPRFCEGHIADAPCRLDEVFTGDFGIGMPADAVIAEEALDFRIVDGLPAQDVNGRLANDLDVVGGIEIGHAFVLVDAKSSLRLVLGQRQRRARTRRYAE